MCCGCADCIRCPCTGGPVYTGCTDPPAIPRSIWYIDPLHGKSPAAGGNGSLFSPWNRLSGILDGRWGATKFSVPGYTLPLLSSVPYCHVVNGKLVSVAVQNLWRSVESPGVLLAGSAWFSPNSALCPPQLVRTLELLAIELDVRDFFRGAKYPTCLSRKDTPFLQLSRVDNIGS
jgi:hypothetical protein